MNNNLDLEESNEEFLSDWDGEDENELYRLAGATSNPSDYYFNVKYDINNFIPLNVIITPKLFFDKTGYQFDQHLEHLLHIEPDYFEICEGSFEPGDETQTVRSIIADLQSRGFIYNPNLPI